MSFFVCVGGKYLEYSETTKYTRSLPFLYIVIKQNRYKWGALNTHRGQSTIFREELHLPNYSSFNHTQIDKRAMYSLHMRSDSIFILTLWITQICYYSHQDFSLCKLKVLVSLHSNVCVYLNHWRICFCFS